MELSQGQDSLYWPHHRRIFVFVSVPLLNVGFAARNSVYPYPYAREK